MGDPKDFVVDKELMKKCCFSSEDFRYEMLKKLSRRLHHGDWGARGLYQMYNSLLDESGELANAFQKFKESSEGVNCEFHPMLYEIMDECVDVAATSMMIFDIAKEIVMLFITQGGDNDKNKL